MKHVTLVAGALLALSAPVVGQWAGDKFDTYPANQQLFNVGGWTGWDNVAAAAGTVDGTRSRSWPNSILCGPTTDAVHPQIGITHGKWTLTAWQYIASPQTADVYFIVNNVYNHGGPYNWVTELQCDVTTGTVIDDLRGGTPQPIAYDQWAEFRLDIDLDANTVSNYYNGALVSQGTWTGSWGGGGGPPAIENIDLFNNGGTCNWDDISLQWRGDSFETYAPATPLFGVGGWTGWDNVAAAAGTADNTRARTGTNSLFAGPTTDAVHPDIGITSGRWVLTAWQYIPSPQTADCYFIVNNIYNHGGPYAWTVELKCDFATGTVVDDLRLATDTPQPIVYDQWVEFRIDIDLDANTVSNYYNGARVSQGVYTTGPRAIANIDLFNNGGTCSWDDVCFQPVATPPCYETNLGTALGAGDDTLHTRPLGFTFPFPGGSTTDIRICSNGFIWLDGVQTSTDFSNSVAEFLGSLQATPRIAAAWRDFDASSSLSDDVYFNAFPDRAVITWHNLVTFLGTEPMTVQCQMLSNGTVTIYYDVNYSLAGGTANAGRTLTGIKAGVGTVADPGNTDYSASLPISTTGSTVYEFFADSALFDLRGRCIRFEPNGANYDVAFRFDCGASAIPYGVACPTSAPVNMTTSAPPVLGATFTWDVVNVPANTTAAALLLGVGTANVSLNFLGFTGCSSYTTLDLPVALPFTPPTASLAGTVPINPQLIGMALHTQAAIVENGVTLYTSNGVTLNFGKN